MMRRDDWQQRLTVYLAGKMRIPFAYGRFDCALFVAGAVEAITGVDHARGWRGYRSLPAGHRRLQAAGFSDHVALVASILPEIAPFHAREGDVAVVAGATGPGLGIVQGDAVYVLRPHGGIGLVPLTEANKAFRVRSFYGLR